MRFCEVSILSGVLHVQALAVLVDEKSAEDVRGLSMFNYAKGGKKVASHPVCCGLLNQFVLAAFAGPPAVNRVRQRLVARDHNGDRWLHGLCVHSGPQQVAAER
jgi:hypothetical protein